MSRKGEQLDYMTELFLLEQHRKKLKNLNRWDKFKLSIYNPERKEFLGKDGYRWGKWYSIYIFLHKEFLKKQNSHRSSFFRTHFNYLHIIIIKTD